VTSKYTVLKPIPSKIKKRQNYLEKRAAKATDSTAASSENTTAPEEPVASFTLKTYDPVSGTCLQYETNKAAEVGRLIGSLGRLGRHMAALPEIKEDLSVPAEGGVATPTLEQDVQMSDAPAQKTGGGGGKKKKKGKK
jgi:hypothetical protein